uniref:Uncharacterized protein n=1 Tax=Odontella aurita TaxID=265563 RepID=A0A7S4HQP9_9STRA|mmetsp:Transcript_13735/g.40185  ORF Transcript_13735/g.40185 Transcript_13735/m.40185 type:complete len:105 (+) Transcript_13735:350-664(+)
MGYATHVVGSEELTNVIESSPKVERIISGLFWSPSAFSTLVAAAWYFTVVAHTAEAAYVAYHCRTTLKTTHATALKWFFLTCCTGFPVTMKATELFGVASKSKR